MQLVGEPTDQRGHGVNVRGKLLKTLLPLGHALQDKGVAAAKVLQQVEQFRAEPVMPFLDDTFTLLLLGSDQRLQEAVLFGLRIVRFGKLPGVTEDDRGLLDQSSEQLDITVMKILVALFICQEEKAALVLE